MSEKGADGRLMGRYGKGRIVQMLVGGKSKEVVDAGLDQLTTYGLLKHLGVAAVNPLFNEMERKGLIETSGGEYPLVSLTTKGIKHMKTGENLVMRWPAQMIEKPPSSGVVRGGSAGKGVQVPAEVSVMELGFDEGLFEKLKRHRTAVARAEGVVAHRVFSNQTLEFMTRLKPLTLEAGKKIRGVGEGKAAEYLPEFIRVIQKHVKG